MSKKTKKIIIWIFAVWVVVCLTSAMIQLFNEESKNMATQQPEVTEVIPVDIEGDSLLLMRCKELYDELKQIKGQKDFKQFGFGEGGPYKDWIKKVNLFSKEESIRLMRAYGIVAGDLEMLGLEYAASKGEETDFSRTKTKELEELFTNPVRRDAE